MVHGASVLLFIFFFLSFRLLPVSKIIEYVAFQMNIRALNSINKVRTFLDIYIDNKVFFVPFEI